MCFPVTLEGVLLDVCVWFISWFYVTRKQVYI